MADLHKAIRAIHNNVVHIVGETKDNIKAYDSSESEVTLNWTNIEAWTDPNAYQISRKYLFLIQLYQASLKCIYLNLLL